MTHHDHIQLIVLFETMSLLFAVLLQRSLSGRRSGSWRFSPWQSSGEKGFFFFGVCFSDWQWSWALYLHQTSIWMDQSVTHTHASAFMSHSSFSDRREYLVRVTEIDQCLSGHQNMISKSKHSYQTYQSKHTEQNTLSFHYITLDYTTFGL